MGEDIRLLSTVGSVYFFIRQKNQKGEEPTVSQIGDALGLTRRTVWGFFDHTCLLIQGEYISFKKIGRKHYHSASRNPLDIIQNADNNSPERQFFTTEGFTLLYIIKNPGCTIKDIAEARYLTRRSVWGMVGNLRRANLIRIEKEGRTHRYFFNANQDLISRLEEETLRAVNH
ncbi:hypothetical protein LCGC14_0101780 [marine sediment metagenome]|uniref:MarR family transcriptional regulator n=1 Tax=marine sediment metagenome TaxID=412755 RepID=A0A0F9YE33_9ZZZZ